MTTTAVAATAEPRKVVLIDLSSLFWTAWHATGAQEVSKAQQITLDNVKRCVGNDPTALVAVCCDSGVSFRKEMLPEYKANRPDKDHATIGELIRIKERLRADGYLLWEAKGFEADDVIATNCAAAVALGHDVLVCSADKDLLQLVGPGVRALRTHTWIEGGEAEVTEKFGVPPSMLGDWLALVGDKSDNIRGAPGIGTKRATDLLREHSNLDAIFYVVENVPTSFTPAIYKSLKENKAAVLLARKLVALRTDVPINFMDIYSRREPVPLVAVEAESTTGDEGDNMDDIPISRSPGPAQAVISEAPVAAPTPPATNGAPAPAAAPEAKRIVTGEDLFQDLLNKRGYAPVDFEKALEPRSSNSAIELAKHLHNSRVYAAKFQTWEAILAIILRGRAMGITSTAALDVFHMIDGKPYPFAYLVVALAQKDPDCEYLCPVEASDTIAVWETKHRKHDKPRTVTFTMEQARIAGLPKPSDKGGNGWVKNPEDMLVKSAGSKLARRIYPGATLGLVSVEEMGEV